MIAKVLDQIKCGKEQAMPTAQAESEAANTAKATNEGAVGKTKDELDSTQKACKDSKLSLAEVAQQFQHAKEALKDAQTKLESNDQDASEATRKKCVLEGISKEIPDLQNRAADIVEVKELMQKIAADLEIDSSMMSAVSLALAKAPETRGEFDAKVIKELEDKVTSRMTELTDVMQKGAPAKAALEAEVKAAEVALEAAKSHQLSSAYAYDKAAKEAEAADEAFKASKKALAESTKSMKKAAQDYDNAQALYELFCDGPMKDFESLCERLAPPPVPEPTAEPEETEMPVDEVAADDAGAAISEMPQPVAILA
jgi:chromosome segregation ATPase